MNPIPHHSTLHTRLFRRLVLVAAGLIIFPSGLPLAEASTGAAVRAVPVRSEPVTFSNEAQPVHATGVLERKHQVDLSFKTAGIVENVMVRAGDIVTKNQILAELRCDEIEAQLVQAKTAFEKAQRDLERTETLRERKVMTLEALQDARSARDAAEAGLRIAEFNRRFAVIVAPTAGRVLRRVAEPNEYVPSGRAILGFASDEDGWILRVSLAERDLARIKVGDRAQVGAGEGQVVTISEAADSATRLVQVEIALPSPPPFARSGSIASGTIFPQPAALRARVAASALVEGNGLDATLFLVEAGTDRAKRMPVEIDEFWGSHAYLRTVLPRTASVVIQGGDFLRDGDVVTVVP